MRFRTPVAVEKSPLRLTHRTGVMLMGSCFTTHIAQRLSQRGFEVCQAMGTLYNPASIAAAVERLQTGKKICPSELFGQNGRYHSYDFHSDFSAETAEAALERMNAAIEAGHQALQTEGPLFVTLGTAWVYRLKESGRVVANCHRSDARIFEREMLTTDACTDCLERICAAAANKTVVWTVSPIRHLGEGLHDNTLSKSCLHLAIAEICRRHPQQCEYFPAYEALMDDLRDYRFYAEDMVHPSPVAADYVYELLEAAYMDDDTRQAAARYEALNKTLGHRSRQAGSERHRQLTEQTQARLHDLDQQYKR
ncbi:MAG: GSCFA domain-containing protein [Paludibacteraceae bacterium]|nr:GSCFA domain-containing protein [Paludibacteraceae bacterium]